MIQTWLDESMMELRHRYTYSCNDYEAIVGDVIRYGDYVNVLIYCSSGDPVGVSREVRDVIWFCS